MLRNLAAISLLTCCAGIDTFAAPAQEVFHAANADESSQPARATRARYVAGFISVFARLKQQEVSIYLTSAIKRRTDLTKDIALAALRIQMRKAGDDERFAQAEVKRVVHTAISADHEAAADVVLTCGADEPAYAEVIVLTALAAAPERRAEIVAAAQELRVFAGLARAGANQNDAPSSGGAASNPSRGRGRGHDGDVQSPEKPGD